MKRNFKGVLSLLLAAVMIFGSVAVGLTDIELPDLGKLFAQKAEAAETSGKCGDKLSWSFNGANGLLTISGTGEMYEWESFSPWHNLCYEIKYIFLPEGITSISKYAFSNCVEVWEITIPQSVTDIGNGAFYGCSGITSVSIPKNVTSIGNNPFADCKKLYEINVDPKNAAYTSDKDGVLFDKDKTLLISYPMGNTRTSYEIPEGVSAIGDSAFLNTYYGDKIKSISIPDTVKIIGPGAFYCCESLSEITFGNGITSIGDRAFDGCKALKDIFLPNSVTNIGARAFYGCSGLTSIVIPNSVTSISDGLFYDCTNLASVIIPDSVISIGDLSFRGCSNLTDITIPENVKSVGVGAFTLCKNLNTVMIPRSLTSINKNAFEYTNISNVYYAGSLREWRNIDIGLGNDDLTNATIHFAETETYLLTLDANGGEFADGSTVFTAEVEYGASLADIIPDAPVMEGYTFTGWNETLPVTMPAHDVTLKAEWNTNTYKIMFETYSESIIAPIYYEYGSLISVSVYPTKEGYVFAGWTDEHGNPVSIPATMPAHDIILYASWEEIVPETYTVTWIIDDASRTENYEVGAAIDIPDDPVKTGYTFIGWTPAVPATMPANNLTFTAVWEEIPEENIYNLGEETYSFDNYGDWHSGGHCFGMSVTSSGYYTGNLDIAEIGLESADKLYTATESAKVKEPICYYQDIQGNNYIDSAVVAGRNPFSSYNLDVESDWEEVVDYVKNHEYDNEGSLQVLTCHDYGTFKGGHAVNFLYYKNVAGQDRIYVYDNNFPDIETYYYKDSYGNIRQAPYSTFYYPLDSIAFMNVEKFLDNTRNFDRTHVIYAYEGEIMVSGIEGCPMFGENEGRIRYIYEIPSYMDKVNVVPLVDNAEFSYMNDGYSFNKVDKFTTGVFTLASYNAGEETQSPGLEIINEPEDKPVINAEIRRPSTTTISYGDSIILHADVEGELPAGYTVKWTASNGNFSYKADGAACTISPEKSGDTTFTATIYDADGNAVSTDEQTMTSNAGFFQKIIAFFKKLFGLTKTIPDIFKF